MISRFFQIIGGLLTLSALALFWGDVSAPDEPAKLLGQLLHELSPQSLQLAEAIIDRYIDPCGLLPFLGCNTFLWHPFIVTLLTWPAGLVLGFFGVAIMLASTSLKRQKKTVRSLKKEGR
ncbi:MAG: hypothetical protein ACON49_07080 [Candidatus Puniceispirillaceae bacterium]